MTAGTIERISSPEPDAFWREYVVPQRPVVVVDLYAGQPLEELATLADAKRVLADVEVLVETEYMVGGEANEAPAPQTVAEYLELCEADPQTRRVVTDELTPTRLLSLLEYPAIASEASSEGPDARSYFFIANKGNRAQLHFDGDHRNVLLTQICGSKRIAVFPPRAARKLLPFGNFGAVCIERLPPEDRHNFLRFAGGAETVLEPGETLFMPALAWHHVDYVDTGMSFNLRFGRSAFGRLVASRGLVHDYRVQAISALFTGEALDAEERAAIQQETREVLERDYSTPLVRYRAERDFFEMLWRRYADDGLDGGFMLLSLEKVAERSTLRLVDELNERAAAARRGADVETITCMMRDLGYNDDLAAKVVRFHTGGATLDEVDTVGRSHLVRVLASPPARL